MTTDAIGTIPDPTPANVIQGQTFTFQLNLTEAGSSTPRSLAGYYAHMQIRTKQAQSGALLADLSSPNDVTDVGSDQTSIVLEAGGNTGQLDVTVSGAVTALLTKQTYYYDLFLINLSDPADSQRLLYGVMTVSNSVTLAGA